MAEDDVPPMRDEFPRWYRAVDVSENRDRLAMRWQGVASSVAGADRSTVETMIAMLLRTKSRPNADAKASFRAHFKTADDMFDGGDNDREMEILSGAALATLLDDDTDIAAHAALSLSVAMFSGARTLEFPFNFATHAEATISRISSERRARPEEPNLPSVPRVGLNNDHLEKLKQGPNGENVPAAINYLATQTNAVLRDFIVKVNTALSSANTFAAIQDEELQLLWWLFGGRSKTMDKPFADMPADGQPIILAKELADATQFLPGPESIKPILSRAGLKERKKTTVAAAINACDRGFLEELVDEVNPSPITQPFHFAMKRKLETDDDTSWTAGWAAVTGIDVDFALPGLELGNLFYRERLGLEFRS